MSESENTAIRKVYAKLLSLRQVDQGFADEADAAKLNALVDELSSLGFSVADFRIDQSDIVRPVATSVNGQPTAWREPMVRPGVFHQNLEALLTFFELERTRAKIDVQLPRS